MVKRIIAPRVLAAASGESKNGFSLVELLTVIAIGSLLAVLALPAIKGLNQAGGFNKSVYTLSDSLNLARSYAMANNTYVYVGLTEVDRTQSATAVPQTTGMGKVALAMVASEDGTNSTANLLQVRPTQTFDFLHIATTALLTTGNMARTTTNVYYLGVKNTIVPSPTFSVPLGGTAKFNFNAAGSWVIVITPQGNLLLNGVQQQWLEIDLLPVSGTATPTATGTATTFQANQSALQIDGVAGSVTVYRP